MRQLLFGSQQGIAGMVYGTIVVMGAIAAGSDAQAEPWQLATFAASTVLVLWLAHVYSHSLAETIDAGRRLDRTELIDVMRRELPIPLAAVVPVSALVLGAAGVLSETTAIRLALGIGLATLVLQGFRYAGVEGFSRAGTIVAIAVNLSLGLVIVALEAALAH
ncbi:MAG: hypothetical protein ACRDNP_09565 [Gaiellaceae bacterium]